jgi:hypothetical protein
MRLNRVIAITLFQAKNSFFFFWRNACSPPEFSKDNPKYLVFERNTNNPLSLSPIGNSGSKFWVNEHFKGMKKIFSKIVLFSAISVVSLATELHLVYAVLFVGES